MTSSSVGVHRHLPHTFILLSLLRALSSSELSAGRIGFTSLVLLWVRAGEGAYYIINPSNFTFRSSISSPLFSRFCFVFIRRRWENNAGVWVCVARRISRTRTGLLLFIWTVWNYFLWGCQWRPEEEVWKITFDAYFKDIASSDASSVTDFDRFGVLNFCPLQPILISFN